MAREYLTRIKRGKTIPFGYRVDPEDPQLLLPVQHELDALDFAIRHRQRTGVGLRPLAAWLSNETGRRISHQGLKNRILRDKTIKNEQQRLRAEKSATAAERENTEYREADQRQEREAEVQAQE